jgi:hypothetical protein
MLNRDSVVWWLLMFGAVFGYLATLPNPLTWEYAQWMNALVVIIGIIAAKLSGSGLAGNNTPERDSRAALGGLLQVYKNPEEQK